ncbi:MAG TPA: PilZ domain-containing protein [Bryobacteraceae bacterium]|nr:PilZ domain-containing protein [Bryobacteraceae bacterium]
MSDRTAPEKSKHKLRLERRKNVRVPTDNPAGLTILGPQPSGRKETRILDTSKDGLKLLVPCELMRGTIVQVHLSNLFILAEVRYCRPAGAAFHAGVLIQDVFIASDSARE